MSAQNVWWNPAADRVNPGEPSGSVRCRMTGTMPGAGNFDCRSVRLSPSSGAKAEM
jgi:hypothetical protein